MKPKLLIDRHKALLKQSFHPCVASTRDAGPIRRCVHRFNIKCRAYSRMCVFLLPRLRVPIMWYAGPDHKCVRTSLVRRTGLIYGCVFCFYPEYAYLLWYAGTLYWEAQCPSWRRQSRYDGSAPGEEMLFSDQILWAINRLRGLSTDCVGDLQWAAVTDLLQVRGDAVSW